MNASTGDDVPSSAEPLLADDDDEHGLLDDAEHIATFSGTRHSTRPSLVHSKYVVACALFSSIGGLIFGYGPPSPEGLSC
jgi:hypothetical protein